MLLVERKKLYATLIAGAIVILGVSLKNSSEQLSKTRGAQPNPEIQKAGAALFVIGWIGIAYSCSLGTEGSKFGNRTKILWVLGSVTAIVTAVMLMTVEKVGGVSKQMMAAIFILGWLSLGLAVTHKKGYETKFLGLLAAVSVIISMVVMLPWQRANCVVDAPGFGMFVSGFGLLALANARPY